MERPRRWAALAWFCCWQIITPFASHAATAPAAKLVSRIGTVDYSGRAGSNWLYAAIGQELAVNDRLRTLTFSEAALRLADFSMVRVGESSLLEMLPPRRAGAKVKFDFKLGKLYFIDRNQPREIEVQTPLAAAAIRGTEFHLAVEPNGRTVLTLIEGQVDLSNALGSVVLDSGDQGTVEPGQAPQKTPKIDTVNVIQWCLYYPGVLDVDELGFTAAEAGALSSSLSSYRAGDLRAALSNYPPARLAQAISPAERLYHAGLQLSTGSVTNYRAFLAALDVSHPHAAALRWLVAAVQLEKQELPPATNASQFVAQSYYFQSQFKLRDALTAARSAVDRSPDFGFAWERLAELEFSFGNLSATERALDRALRLSPRLAQAHALRGFVRLGEDKPETALKAFDEAIRLDGRLANGWLGRGLTWIQKGRLEEGRADLQTATAMEPNRWLLRSYLAKAYSNAAEQTKDSEQRRVLLRLAQEQLRLARQQDPLDPTAWLYSALLHRQQNRIGEAIADLEKSVALNDNRRVYRSRLLLDQDLAVRSANLAGIYESAGMAEVSLRESARGASADYGNFSTHLNMASSFNALRDPARFNLRYESEWFNELLLANLLAKVGAGTLSQNLSQQEYSAPFRVKPFGLSTSTEYFSDGEIRQLASHFGIFGQTSYAFDLEYQRKSGSRPNHDLSRLEWYTRIKQQLTAQDSLFLLSKYQDYESGDNFQYYDPADARPSFRLTETQMPILLGGYHHKWQEGVHTLFLAGRLVNDQRYRDRAVPHLVLATDPSSGTNFPPTSSLFDLDYRSCFETYSAELSQIFQRERHTDVIGARYQIGEFETTSALANPQPFLDFQSPSPSDESLERSSFYGYHTWKPIEPLQIIVGLSYDRLRYPANFRHPPIGAGEKTRERISPKAALVWAPRKEVTVRAAYLQSLGGVSYDESVRLEPTHLAGFSQSFRSVISESLVGSVAAPAYEGWWGAVDFQSAASRSYLSLQGEWLGSEVSRRIGVFDYPLAGTATAGSTPEHLDFEERSLKLVFNQILSQEWFLEASYKFTHSELDRNFAAISVPTNLTAELHQMRLAAIYRLPSGFFARAEGLWFAQHNFDDVPGPGDNFQQVNLFVGYKFALERGDLTLGLLNLTDQDYRLNPLTAYTELPRERLFYARLRLNF